MKKLIFEKDAPSGEVLINLPELGIVRSLKYITDKSFHVNGSYENLLNDLEVNNPDKILIVVNDNSDHEFVKRSYINIFTEEELKK